MAEKQAYMCKIREIRSPRSDLYISERVSKNEASRFPQVPRFRKGSYAVQNLTALGLDVFSLFYIRNIVQQNPYKKRENVRNVVFRVRNAKESDCTRPHPYV